jgi:hypothetical protein
MPVVLGKTDSPVALEQFPGGVIDRFRYALEVSPRKVTRGA